MATTTIKLDRRTRSALDDYAATICLLRKRGSVIARNLDDVEERVDLREIARRMDQYLLTETFDSYFPEYILRRYNVDTGVATVEERKP